LQTYLRAGKGSEIGDFLTTHPSVNCISFTGGDTGISISHKAGMVPLQMELGGKDACIVCSDADLDLAASHIVKGGFSYSGQRCTAVKVRRFFFCRLGLGTRSQQVVAAQR
jgi:glyceraldehyde-3-phosphate dehydrogenase (NADP+)